MFKSSAAYKQFLCNYIRCRFCQLTERGLLIVTDAPHVPASALAVGMIMMRREQHCQKHRQDYRQAKVFDFTQTGENFEMVARRSSEGLNMPDKREATGSSRLRGGLRVAAPAASSTTIPQIQTAHSRPSWSLQLPTTPKASQGACFLAGVLQRVGGGKRWPRRPLACRACASNCCATALKLAASC